MEVDFIKDNFHFYMFINAFKYFNYGFILCKHIYNFNLRIFVSWIKIVQNISRYILITVSCSVISALGTHTSCLCFDVDIWRWTNWAGRKTNFEM